MGENIVCAVIDVDCYPNTPEKIKYGAPPYVGFEFWVNKKDIERNKDHLFDECEYYYRKRCK